MKIRNIGNKLYGKVLALLLIALFFLQGAAHSSGLTLFVIFFLLCLTFISASKITLPSYFILSIFVYFFYLIIGIINGHPNAHIDIKFQLFAFLFYFWLLNNRQKIDFKMLFSTLNILVLLVYLMLLWDLIPNFWNEKTFGQEGRVLGPAITPMVYLLFIYLHQKKKFDKSLVFSLLVAIVYLLMTSNFMNFGIVVLLSTLLAINFRQLFRPIYILSMIALLIIIGLYLTSSFVPEMIASKMEYVLKPWEYPTVKTRIADFQQALNNENFGWFKKIFGEGFGASSHIFRENKLSPSLSRTFSFQEIDNGFYYLYHRGGWSLLTVFVFSHLYLLSRMKNIKAQLGFFTIVVLTNALSIHYYNYLFYLVIPFLILNPSRALKS